MPERLQVSLLCGGQSVEHAISLLSAQNIFRALDASKYKLHIIYISEAGVWSILDQPESLLAADSPQALAEKPMHAVCLSLQADRASFPWVVRSTNEAIRCDVVIPCVHGTYGEDGSLQGLLDMLGVAYVGSGVLGSALSMDKIASKQVFAAQNLPTADWVELTNKHENPSFDQIIKRLGSPVVIKSANLGSSVGVFLVENQAEFTAAIGQAFKHSDRVFVEAHIDGREIECAVLGNEQPRASISGEIVCQGIYSYDAKYMSGSTAKVVVPANLPDELLKKVSHIAVQAFKALGCSGLARFDCFIDESEQVWVNELNTLPGFTDISMYPKLWEHEGLKTASLLDELIHLAQDRMEKIKRLERQYVS